MSTYTVKPGDNLSKIASALGLSGWQELYNANKKVVGSDPGMIFRGQKLTYGSATPSTSSKTASKAVVPSTGIGTTLGSAVADPDRQSFLEKYGDVPGMRPDAMFQAFGSERLNPEQVRLATQGVLNYDRAFNTGGGYMSGRMQVDRQNYLNNLEMQRKEAVNQYTQTQNQLYQTWYDQQLYNYETSKAPSSYQLDNFGIELPTTVDPISYDASTKYQYNPTVDLSSGMFKYGGYSAPSSMYGSVTPI